MPVRLPSIDEIALVIKQNPKVLCTGFIIGFTTAFIIASMVYSNSVNTAKIFADYLKEKNGDLVETRQEQKAEIENFKHSIIELQNSYNKQNAQINQKKNSLHTSETSEDAIKLIWPVENGTIIDHFRGKRNDGINISIKPSAPIFAAASGEVVYTGDELKDYGNLIILRHPNSWLTAYANLGMIAVKEDTYVKQGDIIAYGGLTGKVASPQLHFALRKRKFPIDPEDFLPDKK